jgi:hypothetical protein
MAKTDSQCALRNARTIPDPWFRAQALAYVARYCDENPTVIADQAANAARACADAYQQCAVRAWEIAALAERSDCTAASARLESVLSKVKQVNPSSSRSEALILLLHAAARITSHAVQTVSEMIVRITDCDSHWRCQRAAVDAIGILCRFSSESASCLSQSISDAKLRSKCDKLIAAGGSSPRPFFW